MSAAAWVLVAFLTVIVIKLVLFVLIPLISWPFLQVQRPYDEEHEALTSDGVRIRLYRLRAPEPGEDKEPGRPVGLPVLVVHGIGVNHFCFDVDDSASMARTLQQGGRDVWLADLRGRGGSRQGCPRAWRFDDYVTRDLPAMLAKIREETGAPRVHYLGYSMGGSIGFAWLSRAVDNPELATDNGFQSMLALGAPWPSRLGKMAASRMRFAALIRPIGRIRLDLLSRSSAWWFPFLPRFFIVRFLAEPGNTTPPVLRRAIFSSTAPVSAEVVNNFFTAQRDQHWRSDDGAFDYEEAWTRVTTPVRFLAADRDRVVSPKCVRAAHERCGSPDKELLFLGPETGAKTHYGHVDLTWGRDQGTDVVPRVAEWFDKWDPKGE
jgi:pimeloyl-ACP methyl ester carboxylesterase